jgi:hypothetical protein
MYEHPPLPRAMAQAQAQAQAQALEGSIPLVKYSTSRQVRIIENY